MNDFNENINDENQINLKQEIFRYLSFWYLFPITAVFFISASFVYLKYADYQYDSFSKIEILDKSQDSEMALPTAMTIFNRSMVNLQNEMGLLSSFNLHNKAVKKNNSNVKYFTEGLIKKSENHYSDWFNDYDLSFKLDPDTVTTKSSFRFEFKKNQMEIFHFDFEDNLVKNYKFNSYSTQNTNHNLPFEITINDNYEDGLNDINSKILSFSHIELVTNFYKNNTKITPSSEEGDQLNLSLRSTNPKIANDYLLTLMMEFDKDGIIDRQLEYKRTMDFVDSRSTFLQSELEKIELRKQVFKEKNNLTDIKSDLSLNLSQQISYDSELFQVESQLELTKLLKQSINNNKFTLMPINIGISDVSLNNLLNEQNNLIAQRNRFLNNAGPNNYNVKNIEEQIIAFSDNISSSIENYEASLKLKLDKIREKESEFEEVSFNIPLKEKQLRAIERELEVKEALFILLMQKREEAAINYAVVKPSIKIIDTARNNDNPVSPNPTFIYFGALLLSLFIPFGYLYLKFSFDTKIHTRGQLKNLVNNIPIIGEIPYDKTLISESDKILSGSTSRDPVSESIRMVIANLNFVLFEKSETNSEKNTTILITSSVKGEGKTIISTNLSSLLSFKYEKVLLIGADLRNPQIHKYLGIDKNHKGLSDYIYNKSAKWEEFIFKYNNLDILLSGSIPPNLQIFCLLNVFKFLSKAKGMIIL